MHHDPLFHGPRKVAEREAEVGQSVFHPRRHFGTADPRHETISSKIARRLGEHQLVEGNVARGAAGDLLLLGHWHISATGQPGATLPTYKPVPENPRQPVKEKETER